MKSKPKKKGKAVTISNLIKRRPAVIISGKPQSPPPVRDVAANVNFASAVLNRKCMGTGSYVSKKDNLVEGGSSICRDEDPLPLLFSVVGAKPLHPTAPLNQPNSAYYVSDESPSRVIPSAQPGSSGLVDNLHCSRPSKTRTAPSYAAVVQKGPGVSVSRNAAPDQVLNLGTFAANKLVQKSFHDNGTPETFGQIREVGGQKVIFFTASEIKELAAPFEYTLIGKFSHGFPSMKTLKLKLSELNLVSNFSVSLLEYRHVLLRLSCEEDYTRIFSRQVLYMAGFPMKIFKWTPNFVPQEEAPFAPIWVKLPYLPVHLFDKRSLFTIASAIGKPLRIDAVTTTLSRACTPRICIEIDLSKNLDKEVEIVLDGQTIFQEVEYENIPKFCDLWKHLGHEMSACLKLPRSEARPPGDSVSRPVQVTSKVPSDPQSTDLDDSIMTQ
ncbi:hypothetical protein OROHE_018017 [Orobanche hederae]